jgi:hypothetical protein
MVPNIELFSISELLPIGRISIKLMFGGFPSSWSYFSLFNASTTFEFLKF